MDFFVGLTIGLALVIGVTMGLLGGGGSIFTVPLLVFVAGMSASDAIATSLLVVGAASLVALVPHARAGHVRWRTGLLFASTGMFGALLGARVAARLPDRILLGLLAAVMLVAAAAMLRRRDAPAAIPNPAPMRYLALGLSVGLITGLVGAGGGFLIVPALLLLGGLPMRNAIATSLLVISLNCAAGAAAHVPGAALNWPLTFGVAAATLAGSLAGAALCGRVAPARLRVAFGCLVLVVGATMLVKQLSPWDTPVALALIITVIGAASAAGAKAVLSREARERRVPDLR